ncbi:hypothetical protein CEP88_00715 [Roseobacter denitrificans]|uniref:Lipoprotein n=1 Tax=Roseobacter denitrificans (strain ATCC 33942 / OCh 114) TaxID=375451 RepID=Q167X7_ROSDO|nr:hypothetical protein [Roseobacter denitrificans]ABG31716.1 hypothetical protein RD1_2119 [Roseobacter denitrificans OCh 114]AVL51305.1 hypothetical protein CEP88_00715 [Roseobacter denitrificans]SFF87902.1 hypothetical protein SAMN05443635_103116 [Roseobacter denitrificans OCh 114]
MVVSLTTPARAFLILTGLAALTACAPDTGVGQFYREAGAQVDTGEFGNATLHNQLSQTCRTNNAGVGKAGAQGRDPLVVLDPESTLQRRVYRVHCDGTLDGKFAQVIYREYVGSSVQTSNVQQADAQ